MLPYPAMPYGLPPSWCYALAECSLYLLFFFCLVHASKKGARDVCYLSGGVLFGLLLEYMEVRMGSYTYGRFGLMLGTAPMNIPVCVGAGWGIIMYTARLFSDRLGLALWAAAALDTLLALNIDISMDVTAYRTHMWHWNWSHTTLHPLTAQWFGIPYGNFIGWQTVVFSYSLFSRLFEKRVLESGAGSFPSVVVAVLSLGCSLATLYITEALKPLRRQLGILSIHEFIGISVILIMLVLVKWPRRKIVAERMPAVALWVPGWFHLFFTGCFFILGFYRENVWMTIATLLNLFVGIVIHLFPLSFKTSHGKRAISVSSTR